MLNVVLLDNSITWRLIEPSSLLMRLQAEFPGQAAGGTPRGGPDRGVDGPAHVPRGARA